MKRILDSVHGYIEIDNTYVENIVDTEYFQRLRRVEQTSTRTLFPSARHDRFIHSLGVFHLGCKIVSHLREDLQGEQIENLDGIFESYILACLLHDVAHSPFSHTLEEFYENQWSDLRGVLKQVVANPEFSEDWDNVSDPSAQHERMSAIVAVGKFGDFIRNREADPVLVARMIIGLGFRDRVNHSFENAMIELIHGDVIDADGLDYVCRDAWASGYSTTSVDVERLISSIKIVRDQNNENYYRLCFTSKSLNEIESVLKVKTFQQYYVIHHHTVTYEQRLLVKALESAACFHVFGERNVGDSNRRKEALQRLCQVKCFYSQDGNNWIETDHTHIRIQLPMDDDFVSLMKPVRDDKYVSQWLSRRFLLKPLWKSKAEFYKRFGNLRDVKLTENSWIFHNDCREFINQRTGIPLEDIWIEKATPKYKGKFADKVCRCQRDRSVASAYQTALKKKDDIAIALALSPFARKTAELVKSGAYEAAAGSCYAIFRCLAKTCKEHEDWYAGFTGYGDSYTKLAIFTEAVVELYCHLRQKTDLSKRMADEMDINLEVFNLETDFFGDLHCSSRFTDMLCDAQAQYGDYSELDMCPMWGMWKKEGGENEIKALRKAVGNL